MNRKDFLYACGMALPLSWFGCTGRAISPQQTKRKEKMRITKTIQHINNKTKTTNLVLSNTCVLFIKAI